MNPSVNLINKRVFFVDVARSYAIFLALMDHSLNDFGVWDTYQFEIFASMKTFTSSATPTFLFLFGMMLELIYFRRLQTKGLSAIKPQLIKRSLQCYLGYFLTIVAGVIGGVLLLKTAVAGTVFAANSHLGNILKLYTVLLILAIPLLLFRKRFGIWCVVIISLAYWALYPLFETISITNGSIANFTSTIFGFGGKSGPSIPHSLSMVTLGMLSASFISFEKPYKFLKCNIGILLSLLVLLSVFLYFEKWDQFLNNYLSNTYRRDNHPIYFLLATSLAVINVIVFSLLVPLGSRLSGTVNKSLVFGRNSLSAFTVGNIILNVFYEPITNNEWNILASLFFVAFMFFLLLGYEWASKAKVWSLIKARANL